MAKKRVSVILSPSRSDADWIKSISGARAREKVRQEAIKEELAKRRNAKGSEVEV